MLPAMSHAAIARRFPIRVTLACLLVTACAGAGPEGELIPKVYDGRLVATPATIAFPEVREGCVGSVDLEIANTSPNLPISITNIATPHGALRFAESLPIRIEPGDRRNLAFHFSPDGPGARTGEVVIQTDEGRLRPLALPVTAQARAAVPRAQAIAPAPLDLVFVLDVSTTMNELAALRAAVIRVFDVARASGHDVRFGLTTFENDVRVHGAGRFLEPEAFLAELDSQLLEGSWLPNPELPRQLLNFDFQENILDALALSASEFEFRPDARHFFLLMTDDTFLEPPDRFSDGTPVLHSFAEVSQALVDREVRLFSVHAPQSGRGLSSRYEGAPSLVAATEGAWFEIADVDRGVLALDSLLEDLVAGDLCD